MSDADKINVLYCIEYLSSGGTEKQLMSLIDGLTTSGFQPSLCCLRNSIIGPIRRPEAYHFFNAMDCPKLQLDFLSFSDSKSVFELLKLVQFMRSQRIDIVQTYFQDPAILGLLAAKLASVKHVVACFRDMAFWLDGRRHRHMRFVYRLCSGFIANSKAVKRKYLQLFNLPDNKFTIIYNGVDSTSDQPPRLIGDSRKQHINVGIVANLNRKVKRVDLFIRSAALIHDRRRQIRFTIIGDGELKPDLISLAEQLGISDIITFLGRVSNVKECLNQFDIGVLTSDSEGFSNAILEYMAAGLPVVATAVGGNEELIDDGNNGFLIPPGDYYLMADRIIELACNTDLRKTVGLKAFDTVSKSYSFTKNFENHVTYYRSLLNSGRM